MQYVSETFYSRRKVTDTARVRDPAVDLAYLLEYGGSKFPWEGKP